MLGELSAAQLLITAGKNIDRLSGEASFALLCGVAPIPNSSARSHRTRLDRGGRPPNQPGPAHDRRRPTAMRPTHHLDAATYMWRRRAKVEERQATISLLYEQLDARATRGRCGHPESTAH
jgi:Transposase IS116/IS110/IS902 family